MENAPNRCSEESDLLSDVGEVRVSNDNHMNGRADKLILTTNSILGSVRCFADWSGIVSFVKAWPSEVRSCAVNREKSKRLETRGRRGKATRERANGGRAVCRHSFVITHLWRKRPDILSAMSEAADFYPWSLRCCFFLSVKKKLSCERFIWWLQTLFPNTGVWLGLNQPLSTFVLGSKVGYQKKSGREWKLVSLLSKKIWDFNVGHPCAVLPSSFANINLRTLP